MAFKDRIKEARKNAKMTQKDIADAIGIAKSTYAGYETGNSEPNIYTIGEIVKILRVDPNFLWQDEMAELERLESSKELVLTPAEKELIRKYRLISTESKMFVDNALETAYKMYLESEEKESEKNLA